MNQFSQISYHERVKIYRGLCEGKSRREIAIMLDRAPSTISREVKRNSDHVGYLYPGEAHLEAEKRRNKNVPKISKNKRMRNFILLKLNERWSPATISGSWNKTNNVKISKEAIYQWIYNVDDKNMKLRKLLVRARRKRGLKRRPRQSNIKNRVSVHSRPESINNRKELGHFECDLIFNKDSQSKNICTLIERVTKYTVLLPNENKRTKTVIESLIAYIKKERVLIKSITFDNGSEFANHHLLNDLGVKTYFCDPGAPWQKGSIENLNGVARRYIPFSLKAKDITPGFVVKINEKINNMPRAVLSYKSPNQVARELSLVQRRVG